LHIFYKIDTKLRQKLKYMDQIENEKMTHGIIIAMWHDVTLIVANF